VTNRKLGKYEIIERLGRGGMAEVYKAYHASLDRYVAIKILHAFLADDEEFAARFGREAQNIARLKHPHVVQVYDYEYDASSESYYMIMELIVGDTLKDRLLALEATGKRMPLEEALRITREAATALAYAHKNGMIHRDVKPANLLIDSTENDRVVLTDFGIAKIVKGSQMTVSGGLVGTPAYMAPEQGIGETGDERSDLYSLGIILYQMITGELPYDAETPLALILRHMNDPIPSARALDANIPQPIERIVRKLMAKEPDNRYRSAEELITDIRRVENNLHQVSIDDSTPVQLTPIDLTSYTDAHLDSPTIPFNQLGVRKKDETQRIPPITRTQPLTLPNQGGGKRWIYGLLLLIILFFIGGGYLFGVQLGMFPAFGFLASATPTATQTLTATNPIDPTETFEPTATPTLTLTLTPTTAITALVASTDQPTPTPTYTETATFTPIHTATTETPTVTPNATQTQSAIRTATATACQFDYAIIDQQPQDGVDGGFFTVNSRYVRRITLINTGTCAWERNTSMTFVEGEDFNAGPRVFIRSEVEVGEEIELVFEGTLPSVGSLEPISGIWQLRTPGQIPIGKPLTISVRVYDPGTGGS
jgi:serine/threonine protein kinase